MRANFKEYVLLQKSAYTGYNLSKIRGGGIFGAKPQALDSVLFVDIGICSNRVCSFFSIQICSIMLLIYWNLPQENSQYYRVFELAICNSTMLWKWLNKWNIKVVAKLHQRLVNSLWKFLLSFNYGAVHKWC